MSESPYTQDQLDQIVTAAIASTEVHSGMTEDDWQRAVIRRASTIQKMRFYQDGSILKNVLTSVKLRVNILDVEYEESSTRYLITFRSIPRDGSDFLPEPEVIRTPRMDGYYGELIEDDIERLEDIAGTDEQVIIFKHNDLPTEAQMKRAREEGRIIPQQGYRQAIWFEFV